MEKNKKKIRKGFIVQGGILAIAGLIARAIGVIRRIPLTNIIGDVGNGYYAAAYEIYAIILLLSSYSLPLAVSKLVAQRVSRGQYRNARKVFKGAMIFAVISGGIACIFVLIFADFLAGTVMGEPKSAMALRVLAPTLLIVAIMGVFRGYFQGLGTMTPTAVSQIVEQIFLVVFSLLFADIAFNKGALFGNLVMSDKFAPAIGAAGATLGCAIGALAGLGFLILVMNASSKKMKKAASKDVTRQNEKYGSLVRIIILTILPVILSTVVYNVCGVLDQIIYNHYMISIDQAAMKTFFWGVYSGKYKVLINLPIALASAMCSSVVPTLTGSIANHDYAHAREKTASVIRVTMIITIPCAVGMAVLGKPIVDLLFSGEIDLAANLLYVGSVSIIFYALSTLGNGILQGIGKLKIPVINSIIALVIHLGALWVMLKYFNLGIYSVVIANVLFSLIMCILNHLAISRHLEYKQEWKRAFIIPLISSAAMGLTTFGIYHLFKLFLPDYVCCILSILFAAIVYLIVMLALRGFKEYEIAKAPFGKTILLILRKIGIY